MSGPIPIRVWLYRVAQECGTPDKMETWACCMRSENTKKLMMEHVHLWRLMIEAEERQNLNGSRKA